MVKPSATEPPRDIAIDDLLAEFGFVEAGARIRAREVLTAAGLTNARKRRISLDKRERVAAALDEALYRWCGREGCEPDPAETREAVVVALARCETCGGSHQASGLRRLARAMAAAGASRLLVVGGSPNTHTALQSGLRATHVELRLIDGSRPTGSRAARDLVAWADIVVLWGSTELSHKVSSPFATVDGAKTITVAQRSPIRLADAVIEHLRRRGVAAD